LRGQPPDQISRAGLSALIHGNRVKSTGSACTATATANIAR
jgi:hypothetical protein